MMVVTMKRWAPPFQEALHCAPLSGESGTELVYVVSGQFNPDALAGTPTILITLCSGNPLVESIR